MRSLAYQKLTRLDTTVELDSPAPLYYWWLGFENIKTTLSTANYLIPDVIHLSNHLSWTPLTMEYQRTCLTSSSGSREREKPDWLQIKQTNKWNIITWMIWTSIWVPLRRRCHLRLKRNKAPVGKGLRSLVVHFPTLCSLARYHHHIWHDPVIHPLAYRYHIFHPSLQSIALYKRVYIPHSHIYIDSPWKQASSITHHLHRGQTFSIGGLPAKSSKLRWRR